MNSSSLTSIRKSFWIKSPMADTEMRPADAPSIRRSPSTRPIKVPSAAVANSNSIFSNRTGSACPAGSRSVIPAEAMVICRPDSATPSPPAAGAATVAAIAPSGDVRQLSISSARSRSSPVRKMSDGAHVSNARGVSTTLACGTISELPSRAISTLDACTVR